MLVLFLLAFSCLLTNYSKIYNAIKEVMFYLTTHSTHFIYGYLVSAIRQKIMRGNPLPSFPISNHSFRLTAIYLL